MPDSSELVSVIMPAYNAEKTLAAAIHSVLKQTWTNWELIIINDCSTDKTVNIISRFEELDTRIHNITNKKNFGVSKSRNIGVDHSRGEWIAFLDSDDWWAPEKLALQIEFANVNHAAFTYTGSTFIDEASHRLSYQLYVPEHITYHQLLKQNIISCSSVVIRKTLMIRFPMENIHMHEDFAVWLQILRNNRCEARGLNLPLLTYRISPSSKSGNKIKAARMTFRVYRYIGLTYPIALYYWCWYAVRSLRKYHCLRENGK